MFPLAISRTTPVPASTVLPGSGVIFKTIPGSCSESIAIVLLTLNPAAVKAALTSSRGLPNKPVGTMASPGPSEIVNVTADPSETRIVASGSWLATRSFGILGSGALWMVIVSPANS